ncbi:putative large low complexity coiled coil [Cryptosporidium sp. chipmunk genotype I]|uniref:putative large low complexity coiled coil n=1 Tax=Cryptosporidium sp. chipmunk genotype I TaxID=1280935 RepID=UPI00351A7ECA|nr:putative large low complexity coiled coil [Cryptosporidium sp. chipmunk genotype I]
MYNSANFHEEMGLKTNDNLKMENNFGSFQGWKSKTGYNKFLNDDEVDNVVHVKDVPIYIKYNSVSSTCTSTAPSTPNSRDFDRLENNVRLNSNIMNNETLPVRPQASHFGKLGEEGLCNNAGSSFGCYSVYSRGGILESSNTIMQLFNFRIVKRRHYSNSSNLLKSHNRVHIEMTKPNDFSFLLNSDISDGNDFIHLKSEQRLLVDFQEFPVMLVDLLNRSKGTRFSENYIDGRVSNSSANIEKETVFPGINRYGSGNLPTSFSPTGGDCLNSLKIVLNMNISEGGIEQSYLGLSSGTTFNSGILSRVDSCTLHFVELNHYKEIVHLSLPFEMANEAFFRDYILRHLNNYFDLSNRQQKIITSYETEVDSLRKEVGLLNEKLSKTSYLSAQNERDISERFQAEIKRISERYENDYNQLKMIYEDTHNRELEHWNQERLSSEDRIKDLQQQLEELGSLFNELSKSKSSLEKYIKDDKETNNGLKAKLEAIQSSYDILSKIKSEQEQELNDLKVEYNSSVETNKTLKDELEKKKKEISELDTALDDACKEIEKGNQIISSLQTSLGNVDSKYKQQMTSFSNLKRSFQQVESRNSSLEEKIKDYEQSLDDSNNRQEQLIEENERLRKILIEAEKQIEVNQSVIASLKRQISINESNFYSLDHNLNAGMIKNYAKSYQGLYNTIGHSNSASLSGIHYSLGSIQPTISSVSASRSSYFGAQLMSSAKHRKRSEATFDANSMNRKYSMSVQPRRSQTWTMESVNHEPRYTTETFEIRSQKRGGEAASSKDYQKIVSSLYYRDLNEEAGLGGSSGIKKALETIDERTSSIFTPPNNRKKSEEAGQKRNINSKSNTKVYKNEGVLREMEGATSSETTNKAEVGRSDYHEIDEILFELEGTGDSFERSARDFATPRLKTPIKPIRSDNSGS